MAKNGNDRVRIAVVGLGHFAQTAILPSFEAARGCQLTALFSNDAAKLEELSGLYGVRHALPYDRYDEFLASGAVDAVYIVLPNDMHCDYSVRAARAGVHVLCEKPMAISSEECERMIDASNDAGKKLMIAYRLHFDEATLAAVDMVNSGKLGEPRFFVSAFSQQVTEGNIRTKVERGGGPMFDIGIYCINAARYLFQAEPISAFAISTSKAGDERFEEVPEQSSVVLEMPGQRLATFTCGFGGAKESMFDVVCTNGRLRMDPAYDHSRPLRHEIMYPDGKVDVKEFELRGQVAAELAYFSDCIREDKSPEPSGEEGLADVRVIEAIHESMRTGTSVAVRAIPPKSRPTRDQEETAPRHGKAPTVNVQPPSQPRH